MQDLFTIPVQIVPTDPFVYLLMDHHVELWELPLYDVLEMEAELKPRQLPLTDILTDPVVEFYRNLYGDYHIGSIPKPNIKLKNIFHINHVLTSCHPLFRRYSHQSP